ncbi:hypothetical protein H0H92_007846 [Tricholoma furcatifolium]|nr:hypothetical protein H0H92_007846 [Tricholoma furcatifolium]
MRVRLKKKDLVHAQSPPLSYTPKAGPSRNRAFAARAKKIPALVFTAFGKSLQQTSYLPTCPSSLPSVGQQPLLDLDNNPFFDDPMEDVVSRHRKKRENQWLRWKNHVIPDLVGPYMDYLRASVSFRDGVPVDPVSCVCGTSSTIEVIVVHFDHQLLDNFSCTEPLPALL